MILEDNSLSDYSDKLSELQNAIDIHGEALFSLRSKYFAPTLKEDPAEAELISHKLMIRAGLIRKLSGGIYSYLPLMLRSLRKLERIIRTALNRTGASELLLPAVQPLELWQESGRDKKYGSELLRFKDRHQRDFTIGPTHEEVITDIIRKDIHSYRDLPLNLYQIQTKFRDEIRPRFGLMRGREFIMKDAYSFDSSESGANLSYLDMYNAYKEIFDRCKLKYAIVEADSGAIGGSYSHEFMVLADSGENNLLFCDSCSYASNQEKTELLKYDLEVIPDGPLTKVHTPNQRHVPELAKFMGVKESAIIKSMLFLTEDKGPVLVLIPGHREINLVKLENSLASGAIRLASPEEAEAEMGVPMGFVTPVGAKVKVVADVGVKAMGSGIVGTGEKDYHYTGAKIGRDFNVDEFFPLALAQAGDQCPHCGHALSLKKGIEVGHVFKLGTKYSEAMGAKVQLKDGSEIPIIMGCYGIGLGRTIAASIEQTHDKDGIIWPMPLTPYQVCIVALNVNDSKVMNAALDLALELTKSGVEVLFDDRDERPGLKFKDADLQGMPIRVTVSLKSVGNGVCELKERVGTEVKMIPLKDAPLVIKDLRDKLLQA
ncbi:MAG: proline--tRNA ligase [Deltaproteobacteria bacterium]|jgi:prolyl-tRNA synthetase|nr:proline--tRNA ligase [Deltaproteobacteria bacterium]